MDFKRKLLLLEQLQKTRGCDYMSYNYRISHIHDMVREDYDYINNLHEVWLKSNIFYRDLISREINILKKEIRLEKIKLLKNDS